VIDSIGLKTPKFDSDSVDMFWMGQNFFFVEMEDPTRYAVFRLSDGTRFCELNSTDIRFIGKEDKARGKSSRMRNIVAFVDTKTLKYYTSSVRALIHLGATHMNIRSFDDIEKATTFNDKQH